MLDESGSMTSRDGEKQTRWEKLITAVRTFAEELENIAGD